jgi:molecular chaperone DnaK
MRKDAEVHAADDKEKLELATQRNEASQLCFKVEKMMKEHADKLSDADKEPLEQAIKKTREVAERDDVQAIKSAVSDLEQASHALSKTLYESAAQASPEGAAGNGQGESGEAAADDDAIDAEFEVKDS